MIVPETSKLYISNIMETAIRTNDLTTILKLTATGAVISVDHLELCHQLGRLLIAKILLKHNPNAYPSGYLSAQHFLNVMQQEIKILKNIREQTHIIQQILDLQQQVTQIQNQK